jgi:short subunit fatty acids transporter
MRYHIYCDPILSRMLVDAGSNLTAMVSFSGWKLGLSNTLPVIDNTPGKTLEAILELMNS